MAIAVTITRNGAGCNPKPEPFRAKKDEDVTFEFPGEPQTVIDFGVDSPFGDTTTERKFPADKKARKVKAKPRAEPFRYIVVWPGGDGNGSGEIIP